MSCAASRHTGDPCRYVGPGRAWTRLGYRRCRPRRCVHLCIYMMSEWADGNTCNGHEHMTCGHILSQCMQWRSIESSAGAPSKWPSDRLGSGTRSSRNLSASTHLTIGYHTPSMSHSHTLAVSVSLHPSIHTLHIALPLPRRIGLSLSIHRSMSSVVYIDHKTKIGM